MKPGRALADLEESAADIEGSESSVGGDESQNSARTKGGAAPLENLNEILRVKVLEKVVGVDEVRWRQ